MNLIKPSFSTGYAKNASESANPNLWKGLIGAWMPSFGVTGNTLKDVSGNGNDGTLTNMDAATDWVGTSKGLALDLDALQQRIEGDTSYQFNSSVTICATIKWQSVSYYPRVFDFSDGLSSLQLVWDFGSGGNNRLKTKDTRWQVDAPSYQSTSFGSSPPLVGKWYTYAALFDSTNQINRLYVNSIKQSSSASGNVGSASSSQNFKLGIRRDNNNVTDADAEYLAVSIYNRALSPTEIKQLYLNPSAPFQKKTTTVVSVPVAPPTTTAKAVVLKKPKPSYAAGYARNASESANPNLWKGLVGAWMPSFGVTGNTLKDVSGNGNDGTLTNMDPASDWVATSKGLAINFDRATNYVTTPFRTNYGNTFCYSVWYRSSSSLNQNLIGSYQSGRSTFNFDINYNQSSNSPTSGYISGFAQYGTNRHRFSNTNALSLSDGKWHHITLFVRTGADAGIYFDGKEVPISVYQSDSGSFNSTALDIWLGAPNVSGSSNGAGLLGDLGQVCIYDRILSPAEIKQLYLNPAAPFERKAQNLAVPAAQVTPSGVFNPFSVLSHPLEQ